jgi:hypothetical protein
MGAMTTLRRLATVLAQHHDGPSLVHPSSRPQEPPRHSRTDWSSREWALDFAVTVRDSGFASTGLDYSASSLALVDEFVGLYAEHEVDLPAEVVEGAAGYFVQVVASTWRELSEAEAATLHASTSSFLAEGGSLGERYTAVVD